MKNIKEIRKNERLFIIAIGFAIFLSGMSIVTKDIPVPQAYFIGGVFIVFGLFIVYEFRK